MKSRRPSSDHSDAVDPFGRGFLSSLQLMPGGPATEFPWSIPALRHTRTLPLHPKVTFFVGENGSGKSTLLEAIAQRAGFGEQGGSKNFNQMDRKYWSVLARGLEIARGVRREKDGFFLRAESFYNVATQVEELGIPLKYYGGRSLHHQSHGESFLSLAANRFAGDGLYLLDEPEAALSPSRQLAFLRLMHQQAEVLSSQFIIATHSPILMAYPGALIYHFTGEGIAPIEYEQTEHYALTRDFLLNPKQYLTHLLSDE
jgi:predicted ATPase